MQDGSMMHFRVIDISQNGEQQTPKGEFIPAASHRHRDKTRAQMSAKMFPHLKLLCWLFMGPLLVLHKAKKRFLIKFGGFYNKNKTLTILFIVKNEKITL
jgi:hypothetical protein